MKNEYAGGGVLMHLGAHVFDQHAAIFEDTVEVLAYRDDSRGGIEADCEAELAFGCESQRVQGRISLSRVRNLANRLEIRCEHATLSVPLNERFEVTVLPHNGPPLA